MKAIVLAGGFGTRLRDKVPSLPKPMAPVAGRPFLEYILDRLIDGGVREIILSVGYLADTIVDHFGAEYRGIALSYAIESEPLGTGGAIVHALRGKGRDPVLALNGDTFLNVDYAKLIHWYSQKQSQMAIVLKKVPDVSRYGSVLLSGRHISGFLEKGGRGPGLINAGIYIFSSSVFKPYSLPTKFSFEDEFLQKYCGSLSPRAFVADDYFIDIGIPSEYERAQLELPNV